MKNRVRKLLISVVMLHVFVLCLLFSAGCASKDNSAEGDEIILRVCSWEDYIWDEEDTDYIDMCYEFENFMREKGKNVTVSYSTFGTNENLYNDLKIANGYLYDVVCPSDYMIEKMAREGMLAKLTDIDADFKTNSTYSANVSPYIKQIFEEDITWSDEGVKMTLGDYAAGYMWGTMGYVYRLTDKIPDIDEEMLDWTSIWDEAYRHRVTIKDSVRDSYFVGIAYVYKDELEQLKEDYDNGVVTFDEYKTRLTEIFNRVDEDTVDKVEKALSSLKDNLFGFEVDSGKNDIVTGKIDVYFAWSGDAVYAMDEAEVDENSPVELYYAVPMQGSNVFFDGWCIPEKAQQKEIALEFINFLAQPENAIANMDYIGYTTAIAGENDEILDWAMETYELSSEEPEEEGFYKADLSYFFHNDAVLYTDVKGRQFETQFPTEDIIERCVFMHYFDIETNERINLMWENIKGFALPVWAIILIVVAIVLLIAAFILWKFREKIFVFKERTPKKEKREKYKIVDKHYLN